MDQINYERTIIEVQELKKALNSHKFAHEATIKQLESSYDLNQQLQSISQTQTKTITHLKKQLSEKDMTLQELSNVYENQIIELKEFIAIKDQELAGIRSSLMVTDYDMIRLRVINELEHSHKDELEAREHQIQQLDCMLREQRQRRVLSEEKALLLKEQLKKQAEDFEQRLEEKERKFHQQLNKSYEQVHKEKAIIRDKERMFEASVKKYELTIQKLEDDCARAYQSQMNGTVLAPNTSPEFEKVTELSKKISQFEMEYESLKKRSEKEESRLKKKIDEMEKKLGEQINSGVSFEEHSDKLKQKDEQIGSIIREYERKIRNLKNELEETATKLHREQMNQVSHPISPDKQNQSLSVNIFQEGLAEIRKAYEQRTRILEEENRRLQSEAQVKMERGRDMDLDRGMGNSWEMHKAKLAEANRQIMKLLKEKVVLKGQLKSLKGGMMK